MGKSKWDGYDYKNNYDSSISYDEPSSYRIALKCGNIRNVDLKIFARKVDFMN